jgi:hypothetical protein
MCFTLKRFSKDCYRIYSELCYFFSKKLANPIYESFFKNKIVCYLLFFTDLCNSSLTKEILQRVAPIRGFNCIQSKKHFFWGSVMKLMHPLYKQVYTLLAFGLRSQINYFIKKWDITSQRVITPSQRVITPSQRVITPSQNDCSNSQRVITPSPNGCSNSQRVITPSPNDCSNSQRVITPSPNDCSNSQRVITSSQNGCSNSQRVITPSPNGCSDSQRVITCLHNDESYSHSGQAGIILRLSYYLLHSIIPSNHDSAGNF